MPGESSGETVTPPPAAPPRCQTWGSSPDRRHARGYEYAFVPEPYRLPVGPATPRPAPQEHGVRLLQPVARRRHLATEARYPAGGGPATGWASPHPQCGQHRFPDGEGDRGRGGARL